MLGNLLGGKIKLIPPLDNLNRIRILELCRRKPYKYNIRSLSRELGVGIKSIFYHIKILEKENLIKTKKATCKGGYETLIATNTKHPLFKEIKIRRA